jgi:hypothetical protein
MNERVIPAELPAAVPRTQVRNSPGGLQVSNGTAAYKILTCCAGFRFRPADEMMPKEKEHEVIGTRVAE